MGENNYSVTNYYNALYILLDDIWVSLVYFITWWYVTKIHDIKRDTAATILTSGINETAVLKYETKTNALKWIGQKNSTKSNIAIYSQQYIICYECTCITITR